MGTEMRDAEETRRLFELWRRQRGKDVNNEWINTLYKELEEERKWPWHAPPSKFVWSDVDPLPPFEPMSPPCPLEVGDTIEVQECIIELIGKLDMYQVARTHLSAGSYVAYFDWSYYHGHVHDPYAWLERLGVHKSEYVTGIEWVHLERNVAVYATGITSLALMRLLSFSTTCIIHETTFNESIHMWRTDAVEAAMAVEEANKGIGALAKTIEHFFPGAYRK